MKLISSRGSRSSNRSAAQKLIQYEPEQPDAFQSPVQISMYPEIPRSDERQAEPQRLAHRAPRQAPPSVPQRSAYPEVTLSDAQRAALQGVIRQQPQQGFADRPAQGSAGRLAQQSPAAGATQQGQTYRPVRENPAARPTQQSPAAGATQQGQIYRPVRENPAARPTQQSSASRPVQQSSVTRPMQHSSATRPMRQTPPARPAHQRPTQITVTSEPRSRKEKKRKRSAKGVVLTIFLILAMSGAGFTGWYYWWTTHATFEYRLQPIVILEGQSFTPNDFLYPGEDSENISAEYRNIRIRTTSGRQDIPLTLTMGWRTVDAVATLYVLTPIVQMSHEFADPGPELRPVDFLSNAGVASNVPFDVSFTEIPMQLEEYPVGNYTLHLELNGAAFQVNLYVADTTKPTATPVDKTIRIGGNGDIIGAEDVVPMDFVTDIFDASPIASVSFVDKPDIFSTRDQIVEIVIEDIYGNTLEVVSSLTILLNESPPVVEGTDTIVTMVNDPILYRQGVTAHDSFGRELEVQFDASEVNQFEKGVYTVKYWAVDLSGQMSEIIEEIVHVLTVDLDYVYNEVDKALASILTDNMTQLQQVQAIHSWVRRNVSYSMGRGGPVTAHEGAYRALRDRRGNCYIFYSISEILLTRAGIENMRIERKPGYRTTHLWNLVNPDGLGWHHYDSFPTRLGLGTPLSYFTDSQSRNFSRQIGNINGMHYYYTYDPELYPEVVP